MQTFKVALIALSVLIVPQDLLAYGGGGGGGTTCSEPQFSAASPANESTVTKLDQFVVEVSKNTDLKTLQLEVDGVRQSPKISPLLSGDYRVEISLSDFKFQNPKVRITLRARSDDGCEGFQPFYVHVKS